MTTSVSIYIKAGTFSAFLLTAVWILLLPMTASAVTVDTVAFELEKNISDNITPNPYTADQFSFRVSGNGIDELVTLTAHTDDTAKGIVNLPEGTYTVEEIGPDGFVPEDWTVQWSGYGCDNKNSSDLFTNMTVTESDSTANVCRADNQWRPQTSPVPGCTDATANNFDMYATIDDGSCTYDTDSQLYLIDGYVWHDVNENGAIDDEEDLLEDWELQLTKGTTTLTTTSNAEGYFSFSVVEGTYTLSEVLKADWSQVYPTPTSYTIAVPDDLDGGSVTIGFPFNLFFSVAHAQVVTTGGPYNFGNVYSGGGGSGGSFTCSFSASETSVSANTTVTLTWDMPIADSVSIDNGIGTTTVTGNTDVLIVHDITYTLTATKGTDTAVCPISITVPSGGGGGGSSSPKCTSFDASVKTFTIGEEVTLSWETSRGRDMTITANSIEVFSSDDSSIVDKGSFVVMPTTDTKYVLTVFKGNKSRDCSVDVTEDDGGRGGGSGDPQVLGEQVSVVPTGAPNAGAGGTSPDIPNVLSLAILFTVTALVYRARKKEQNV